MEGFEERSAAAGEDGTAVGGARPSLARLLDEEGVATRDQVEEAFVEGAQTGERLGEVLLRRAIVDEVQLARLLARQWGLAFLPQERVAHAAPAASIPPAEARELGAAVLHVDGRPCVVVAEPNDARIGEIRRRLGDGVEVAVVAPAVLEQAIARLPEETASGAPTGGFRSDDDSSPLAEVLAELDRGTTKLLVVRARLEDLLGRIAEHDHVTARHERELAEARRAREEDQAVIGRLRAELEQRNEMLSFLRTKLRELSSSLEFHQGM